MRRRAVALALGVSFATPALADEPAPPSAPASTPSAPTAPTANSAPSASGAPSATPAPSASSAASATAGLSGEAAIAAARLAVEEQRYEEALGLLGAEVSSRSRKIRAAALELLGVVRLLLGRVTEGREAVAALHEMAPAFQLEDPSLPPRVTKVFEAEAALTHGRSVTLSVRPAEERGAFEISVSQALAMTIELSCASRGAGRRLGVFRPVAVTRGEKGFRFRLPVLGEHACHAVARDGDGLPLGRLGSSARPVEITPPPVKEERPLVQQWWLWTAVGAVAAGIAVGAAVATQGPKEAPSADITVRPQQVVLSW
ncbi:MAG: hypothetical protein R3F14_06465 [Polyangiaceae bacterium]